MQHYEHDIMQVSTEHFHSLNVFVYSRACDGRSERRLKEMGMQTYRRTGNQTEEKIE